MPKSRTRVYASEFHKVSAIGFKRFLNTPLGTYKLDATFLSHEHRRFELIEVSGDFRTMVFTLDGKQHSIALKLDDRSVSNKLYITCPCCTKNRQYLFVTSRSYACRQCLGLHYLCQSECRQDRLRKRIRKLRKELWGNDYPFVSNMFEKVTHWPKPKYVHQKTFLRKRDKILELENRHYPILLKQQKAFRDRDYL
jgi:hypothetical protein